MGKVILVGAGPGDIGLLTIKGKEYVEKADCIVYDRLLSPELLAMAKPGCECIYVGKENHKHVMKQDDINELLYRKAEECALTVRLKGGDPYVFGRGGEEAIYLLERGIEVDEVPGVSSSVAALASAGIPITHRGMAKGFHVITAHSRKDEPTNIDYTLFGDSEETGVFLMGLSHVEEVAKGLMDAGRDKDTPVAVVSHGTTAQQRTVRGTLADIADKVEKAGVTSPAIIVVGTVVSLSEQLNFHEKAPLFGKRYLVPYVGDHALAKQLSEKGAEVTAVPVGQIEQLRWNASSEEVRAILEGTDWLVFTSKHGVHAFVHSLTEKYLDIRSAAGAKFAVVGTKTREALFSYGIRADYVAKGQSGESLARELHDTILREDSKSIRCVYISAEQPAFDMGEVLSSVCDYRQIALYKNRELSFTIRVENYDGIFFTSASAVRRVCPQLSDLSVPVYSIGPSCTKALQQYGATHIVQSETPSYEAMIELAEKA